MSDNPDDALIDAWVDGLAEIGELREQRRKALLLVEDLLADPYVLHGARLWRLSDADATCPSCGGRMRGESNVCLACYTRARVGAQGA